MLFLLFLKDHTLLLFLFNIYVHDIINLINSNILFVADGINLLRITWTQRNTKLLKNDLGNLSNITTNINILQLNSSKCKIITFSRKNVFLYHKISS